jgi:hypothetical protein
MRFRSGVLHPKHVSKMENRVKRRIMESNESNRCRAGRATPAFRAGRMKPRDASPLTPENRLSCSHSEL